MGAGRVKKWPLSLSYLSVPRNYSFSIYFKFLDCMYMLAGYVHISSVAQNPGEGVGFPEARFLTVVSCLWMMETELGSFRRAVNALKL